MQRHLDYFTHFSAIGFPIASQIEFERLLKMAFENGQAMPFANGKYVVWEPGEGVQLWVKVKDRVVLGCAPHYRGEGTLKVSAQGFYSRPEDIAVTDGALLGTVLPADAASAQFALVVDMPGFEAAASRIVLPKTVTVQVTAFAREMNCFPDSSSFARWQRANKDIPDPESLIFPALPLAPSAPSANGLAPAEALITARVLKAQMRINPITQQNFIALVAAMPGGGTLDIAANPQSASGELLAGGIIHGAFWLSGTVLETAASETPERTSPGVSPMLSRLTGWVRGGS